MRRKRKKTTRRKARDQNSKWGFSKHPLPEGEKQKGIVHSSTLREKRSRSPGALMGSEDHRRLGGEAEKRNTEWSRGAEQEPRPPLHDREEVCPDAKQLTGADGNRPKKKKKPDGREESNPGGRGK